jgi:hypothetical protein
MSSIYTLLKNHEKCSSKSPEKNIILTASDMKNNILVYPYECTAGKHTIGWGVVISDEEYNKYKQGIPYLQCEAMFLEKVKEYENCIKSCLEGRYIKDCEFEAMLSLCYHIGVNAFKKSTVIKCIKSFLDIRNESEIKFTFDSEHIARLNNVWNLDNVKNEIKDSWRLFCKIKDKEGNRVVSPSFSTRRDRELDCFFRS